MVKCAEHTCCAHRYRVRIVVPCDCTADPRVGQSKFPPDYRCSGGQANDKRDALVWTEVGHNHLFLSGRWLRKGEPMSDVSGKPRRAAWVVAALPAADFPPCRHRPYAAVHASMRGGLRRRCRRPRRSYHRYPSLPPARPRRSRGCFSLRRAVGRSWAATAASAWATPPLLLLDTKPRHVAWRRRERARKPAPLCC